MFGYIVTLSLGLAYLSAGDAGIVSKCKSDDSDCILKSAQALLPKFVAGLPEYGVKAMDPINFKKIDASIQNLKLIVTDVTVTGLKTCALNEVKREKFKNKMFMNLLCSIQIEGQYEMDGQLLFVPIKGKGPVHVTLRKVEFNVDVDVGEKEKKGVTYWDIKGYKYTFTLNGKSDVDFENLFDGNENLVKAARTVLSESANDILLEVGQPVSKTVIQEVVKEINAFYHKVPAEELSID